MDCWPWLTTRAKDGTTQLFFLDRVACYYLVSKASSSSSRPALDRYYYSSHTPTRYRLHSTGDCCCHRHPHTIQLGTLLDRESMLAAAGPTPAMRMEVHPTELYTRSEGSLGCAWDVVVLSSSRTPRSVGSGRAQKASQSSERRDGQPREPRPKNVRSVCRRRDRRQPLPPCT